MAATPRKQDRSSNIGPAWRRALIVSFLIIALASGIYGTQQIELFLIRDQRFTLTPPAEYGEESPALHVTGLKFASRREVLRVFQQDVGRSLYLFPMADRYHALTHIPWVKEASILRTWPNQIKVHISERQPIAFIETRSESISRWWLIDEEGIILEPPPRTTFDIPVVTGVRIDEGRSTRAMRMRRMLRMLDELGPSRTRISEVNVADLDNLKVTLKVDRKAIVLMLGDHNFHARFQNFLDHYADIQKRISDVSALDLRLDDRIISVSGGGRP
jgi:cell division protein FtsQ